MCDIASFIQTNLLLTPVPLLTDIRIHTAHPGSGLRRLLETRPDAPPPYWAYPWAGGIVLARYLLDNPSCAAGRHVLDLGAGSGIVGIAAARTGALSVTLAETDPLALAAARLNIAANGVNAEIVEGDLLDSPPPGVDLVAVGDLFYEQELACRVTAYLDRCVSAGIEVLVGDPGRAWLPRQNLQPLAELAVPDVGDGGIDPGKPSAVYAFRAR